MISGQWFYRKRSWPNWPKCAQNCMKKGVPVAPQFYQTW